MVARILTVLALPCVLALGVLALTEARFAGADETPPPSVAPPPVTDPTAQAELSPGVGAGENSGTPGVGAGENSGSAAPAPEHAVKADSVVTASAPHDTTLSKTSPAADAQTKDPQPAERIENASTAPAEKPREEAVPAPSLSGPGEAPKLYPGGIGALKAPQPRAVAPKSGSKGIAVRGLKGMSKTRALATAPGGRSRTNGALPRPDISVKVPAPHDGFTEADRVASELERTERFVGRAQKSVFLSKNTRAMKLFTSALDFQSDSREAAKVRQYARAERLTLAARDFADRASRMVGPPREDPDYVEHVLRRTDDALERAKDVLKTGAGRDAWSQHEELKQEQKDAWKVFKGGDIGSAYRQTQGVREGVLALLRQLQDLPVPRETAEKAIGGAQAALEQANKELGPKPSLEAVRLVRLASEYLAKARQSFSRGSYRSALLQAKVVERHVEHAVDVGRPRSG